MERALRNNLVNNNNASAGIGIKIRGGRKFFIFMKKKDRLMDIIGEKLFVRSKIHA